MREQEIVVIRSASARRTGKLLQARASSLVRDR